MVITDEYRFIKIFINTGLPATISKLRRRNSLEKLSRENCRNKQKISEQIENLNKLKKGNSA